MKTLKEIEKDAILNSLKLNNGNRTHTAKALGIGIRTLQRKLERYGVPKGFVHKSGTVDKTKQFVAVYVPKSDT